MGSFVHILLPMIPLLLWLFLSPLVSADTNYDDDNEVENEWSKENEHLMDKRFSPRCF